MSSANDLVRAIEEIAGNALNAENVREIAKCEASSAITAWAELNQPSNGEIDRDEVESIVRDAILAAIGAMPPKEITIDIDGVRRDFSGKHLHHQFENCLRALSAGCHIMMVGPAGSGKSTLARQLADALGRKFFTQGAASNEYKYLGYNDANGNYVPTQLYHAARDGGVWCGEEVDAGGATAMVSGLNMVLANGTCDFGNQTVEIHPDFVCIATANTWGLGASREYVGRNQLDAATLDRFVTFEIDYDEAMERAVAQSDRWVDMVQKVRKAVFALKIRAVVSPRASIQGAALLRAGIDHHQVAQSVLWRGMDADTVEKIKSHVKSH